MSPKPAAGWKDVSQQHMHGKIFGEFREKEDSMSHCDVATKKKKKLNAQTSVKTNTLHKQNAILIYSNIIIISKHLSIIMYYS